MDPEAIQMACMADLGRLRQEELPLSNKERKGPSFAPSGRNGTSHYAPSLRKGLEDKWNVTIVDDETDQMKGLSVKDSRPWAKKVTQDFMNRNRPHTAPPCIRQESRGHKRARRPDARVASTFRPAMFVPTRGSAKRLGFSGSTLPSRSRSPPPRSFGLNIQGSRVNSNTGVLTKPQQHPNIATQSDPAITANKANKATEAPEAIANTANLALQPSKAPESEQVVLRGICSLLNATDRSVLFVVTYAMKVQNTTDKGYLMLSSAGKEDRVHDVLDLMAPDLKSDCCLVRPKDISNEFGYMLKFANVSDAHKFKIYLESLQQAAAREANLEQTEDKAAGMFQEATQTFSVLSSQTSPAPISQSPSGASETTGVVTSATSTVLSTVTTPTKTPVGGEATEGAKLVDLDSPPHNTTGAREFIIEDAAEKLVEIINKILPEATAAGLRLSDDTITDIEDTAIDDWLHRGFLQSETDDMRADLLDLLRILVRLKRKAESRKKGDFISPSLQDLNSDAKQDAKQDCIKYTASEISDLAGNKVCGRVMEPRITYTASEMKEVARCSISVPADLDKSIITTSRAPKAQSCSPAAAVANVAKHADWLAGKSDQAQSVEVTPPAPGLSASR